MFKQDNVGSTVDRAFLWFRAWLEYPSRQAALTRKIVDRIRNSLELPVVLQTAVDEVAALLRLDRCMFLGYVEETQQVEIICERCRDEHPVTKLGFYSLESFGHLAEAIATGTLLINRGREAEERGNPNQADHSLDNPLCDYRASLLIPVTGKEQGIGFMACFAKKPRPWKTGEIQFLESIAESLEVAIRQAQLYEKTQKQAIQEKLVNHITTQTRQSFDVETILTEAIEQLRLALDADRCLVHLVEDGNHPERLPFYADHTPGSHTGAAFRRKYLYEACHPPFAPSIDDFDPSGPITQWVIQHHQLVVISDITQDDRIGKANEEYQKAQIKSSLVVPVQANDTLHAILYLNQCSHIRYWSKQDQELAQAVADQLAISLQQAYLYSQTQQQAIHSALQAQKLSEMIEELRLTQVQLIQSEKMSSLGRMVAGVAHEINNPINFISGNIPYVESYVNDLIRLVQTYQSEYPQSSPRIQVMMTEMEIEFLLQDLPKILQSMKSGAERIYELVQLLQKFSRHNESAIKRVDLNVALENTLLILHNQLVNTIHIERDYEQLPPVECYPKQINQVFLSILTNAIEALNRSPNRDKIITLRTQWIPASGREEEDRVQIAIADNGLGIQPEIQSSIFEPFFTTKEIGEGRGLGLTVSYQTIVNQHQGQLQVNSQLNRGTEFILEIPVRHRNAVKSSPSAAFNPVTSAA